MTEIDTLMAEIKGFREYTETQFEHGRRRFEQMEGQLEKSIEEGRTERAFISKRVHILENLATFAKGFKAGAIWIVGGSLLAVGGAIVYAINHLGATGK